MDAPKHLVVMGVSGSGKTAVALRLAERLEWPHAEADDFHPPANRDKMAAGHPLTDEDRLPWLRALADWTGKWHQAGESTVMTCSALRRSYRDLLRGGAPGTVCVHLVGDKHELLARMRGREHFFPPELLESQLDTLEPLEPDETGFSVDAVRPLDTLVADVLASLGLSQTSS
ncbi:MAG: gluconokinase [Actinomycetota bacterium]|nr:gluconokinase [Actinomycetota bacterium]